MNANRELPKKLITIRGIVMPPDWTSDGKSTEVLVIDEDEEEYVVHSLDRGINLGRFVDSVVEATGFLYERDGSKTVAVKRIKVIEAQGEFGDMADVDDYRGLDEEAIEDEEYISEFSRSIKDFK